MSSPIVQVASLVLPRIWSLGTETETIADLVTHVSNEFEVKYLANKSVKILATEILLAPGVPGNLECWIELSPYPSTISAAYWAAIGGGGGTIPPLAPIVLAGTGVNLAQQTQDLDWGVFSGYARVVVQTPVAAALPVAFWVVQALFEGQAV